MDEDKVIEDFIVEPTEDALRDIDAVIRNHNAFVEFVWEYVIDPQDMRQGGVNV